ncbi:uncharacterized protein LOC129585504 [Paramacrobiotus metropolitanus]|uniref:uncharacterized protein LOC129585504 n=1 Tax=Paramacrobiotus metropolitanus TaxID=2943436 RepID=UPI002445B3CD|nr:uncharacterized protein LOC129585504 [Paramacrobiotus metropolitanus]
MLSSDYVKAVIGRRFLADEDDLMKLLEHAGVLQADEEAGEENDEERKDEEWDEGEVENEPYRAAPVPKRRKVSGKKHSGLPQKTAISRSQASLVEKDAESHTDVSGSRRPVDVLVNALDKPSTSSAETAAEEDADVDLSGLPSGDDQDDMPLGYDETGSPRLDSEDEHAEAGLEGEHDPGDASEPRTHTAATSYEGRDFSFEEVLALIDGVHAQPFLWQKSSIAGLGTAARTQERRVAWANVAEMVNQTGTGVPKSCQDCMWKWENVRATYRRLVRTNAERTTTWPFIEKLAFTKPEIMQRRKRRVYNSKKIPSTT